MSLDLQFKSQLRGRESRCLVRFHNCTKYNVTLYWIDFSGKPVKYPTVKSKESCDMNTFESHLWFFQTSIDQNGIAPTKKVLAIPEESLNSTCNASSDNYKQITDPSELLECRTPAICALCRYILKTYQRKPTSSPCHHYSGTAKLCSSDLYLTADSDFNSHGAFIYSCSDVTHHQDHTRNRRNVYLVETFYTLRERCFIELSAKLDSGKFVELNLPTTIIREYSKFVGAVKKLSDPWCFEKTV